LSVAAVAKERKKERKKIGITIGVIIDVTIDVIIKNAGPAAIKRQTKPKDA